MFLSIAIRRVRPVRRALLGHLYLTTIETLANESQPGIGGIGERPSAGARSEPTGMQSSCSLNIGCRALGGTRNFRSDIPSYGS